MQYKPLRDRPVMDAFGYEPDARDKAEELLRRVENIVNTPEMIEALTKLDDALKAVRAIKDSDVGAKMMVPLEKVDQAVGKCWKEVGLAVSATRHQLREVIKLIDRDGVTLKQAQVASEVLDDRAAVLRQKLTALDTCVTRAIPLAIHQSLTVYREFQDQYRKANLDKNYASLHPTEARAFEVVETVTLALSVAASVAGIVFAVPVLGGIVKTGLSGAISGIKFGLKKKREHDMLADEEQSAEVEPLLPKSKSISSAATKAKIGGYAAKGILKVTLTALDFTGVPASGAVEAAVTHVLDAATLAAKTAAMAYDNMKNEDEYTSEDLARYMAEEVVKQAASYIGADVAHVDEATLNAIKLRAQEISEKVAGAAYKEYLKKRKRKEVDRPDVVSSGALVEAQEKLKALQDDFLKDLTD